MKMVYSIYSGKKLRIFIRNRWTEHFRYDWPLIAIERARLSGRVEYRFCLIGFELMFKYKII